MDTSLWIDKDVAAVDAVDAGLLLLSLCKSKNIVYMGYIGTVIQNVAYITNLLRMTLHTAKNLVLCQAPLCCRNLEYPENRGTKKIPTAIKSRYRVQIYRHN